MVTTEAYNQAQGVRPVSNGLPKMFEGVKAVRMNDHRVLDVVPKDGLKCQWVAKPRGGDSPIDQVYFDAEENGWRRAKQTDVKTCRVPWNEEKQGFFKMDVILMVNDRDHVLGMQRAMYEDAQSRVGIHLQSAENKMAEMNQRQRNAGGEGGGSATTEVSFREEKLTGKK